MTAHDIRFVPPEIKKLLSINTACYRCGLYDPFTNVALAPDGECDEHFALPSMKAYQAGGGLDPFAKYRYADDEEPFRRVEADERPGLTTETIDWEAHKAFGRSL